MKTEGLKLLALFLAFLIIFIGSFALMGIGIKQEHIVSPCVDGDGDVNLAGIMCDKLETSFFDMRDDSQVFILILALLVFASSLGLFACFVALILLIFQEDEEW